MSRDVKAWFGPAYQRTTYLAVLPGNRQLPLHIDQIHPDLDTLLKERGEAGWAFLTACNPSSELKSEAENAARMEALRQELDARGNTYYPGFGTGDDDEWPPEESFLVLDLPLAAATELAVHFGQYAFVYGGVGKPAQLVWTQLAGGR